MRNRICLLGVLGVCLIAVTAAAAGAAVYYRTSGRATANSTASETWANGVPVYMSETAGDATTTAPVAGGSVVQRIGTAVGDAGAGTTHIIEVNIGGGVTL